MLSIFSCVYLPSYFLLGKMSLQIFCLFSSWIVLGFLLSNFKRFLFFFFFGNIFLDTRPFWSERFSNIFFPSVSCLFILLKEFSSEQKFLICLEFSLSVFPFTDYAFGVMSKNFPDPRT